LPIPSDETLNTEDNSSYIIEEFVEGTMINLFYFNNMLEVATKRIIGAETSFF
jgi:5-formaminoimidazole-4-carboxamide-1-beta-D-ribofuranosyl 5'-monophosphate synthetase